MSDDVTTLRFVAEIQREHLSKDVVLQVLEQIREHLEQGKLSIEDFITELPEEDLELIDVICHADTDEDGETYVGRLIGLEDMSGHDVRIGDWVNYEDQRIRLRIPVPTSKVVRS